MMVNRNSLISVIVPVYNAEKYLSKCIKSIINQTYTNLEIILVNDGSTDSSGKICDEYEKIDNRIIVIHKENEGQGMARKIGISKSRGKYVGFVDSDDYIDNEMYNILYKKLIEYSADISICGRVNHFETGTENQLFCCDEHLLNREQAVKDFLLYNNLDGAMWDKLFKKELLLYSDFPHKFICEDLTVVFDCICRSNKIIHTGVPLYYYVQRMGSTSHSNYTLKSNGLKMFPKEILEITKSFFPKFIHEAESYYFRNINAYLKMLSNCSQKELYNKERRELNNQFFKRIFKSRLISRNVKRELILHCTNLYIPCKKFYRYLKRKNK